MGYSNTINAGESTPTDTQRIKTLCTSDIPAMLALENACWIPGLRATAAIFRKRFELGHISLGIFDSERLVGMFSFSYSLFSPDSIDELPVSFSEFSSQYLPDNHNTAFAYNLNIHPGARGSTLIRELLWAGLDHMRNDGCGYLLAAVRCPSYNGSLDADIEAVQPSPEFKKTIDSSIQTGKLPTTKDLTVDPLLKFYQRTLDCVFLKVIPDFLPVDRPSGGFGVMFYITL